MTVTNEPTAPPPDDENEKIPIPIPIVAATAIPTNVPTASATAYVPDDNATPPARPGMSMVTKTVTYPDGRKVSEKLIAILSQ